MVAAGLQQPQTTWFRVRLITRTNPAIGATD
jgi:hypothetical protein